MRAFRLQMQQHKTKFMRAIIQRVQNASVSIEAEEVAAISYGVLVLLGIEDTDTREDIIWLSGKIARLRIFNDGDGVMNKSLVDTEGEALVVSQFTLHASTKKGNRPSYIKASKPPFAIPMYEQFVAQLKCDINRNVQTGRFGANMQVQLLNDGPVTIFIDTKNKE